MESYEQRDLSELVSKYGIRDVLEVLAWCVTADCGKEPTADKGEK